ncbi:DUF2141 domain-containing protein [Hellea balneolensis]|uniref:DUF2141 domain-containing protein n=1 Tax=Hellea balneolensis TaxID=287478 RepID=UPI000413296A|nr:DUF2141 domain-containing protein [Hellea balneolensis]
MFVSKLKTLGAAALLTTISAVGATAADVSSDIYEAGDIPVTVNLSGVQIADGPIYISLQKREQYRGMAGHGAVLKLATPGNMTAVVNVSEPGDYSVSVWHDMNDDKVFGLSESYRPTEGWGASGAIPTTRVPTFDDVKITVESFGTTVNVPLVYPS